MRPFLFKDIQKQRPLHYFVCRCPNEELLSREGTTKAQKMIPPSIYRPSNGPLGETSCNVTEAAPHAACLILESGLIEGLCQSDLFQTQHVSMSQRLATPLGALNLYYSLEKMHRDSPDQRIALTKPSRTALCIVRSRRLRGILLLEALGRATG